MKIEDNNQNIEKKVSAFKIFKPYIYMAFCIIILAIAVKGLLYFSVGENKTYFQTEEKEIQYSDVDNPIEKEIFNIYNEKGEFIYFLQDEDIYLEHTSDTIR